MQLAISKNSGHYNYFIKLNKFWGVDSRDRARMSLCRYAHVLFWVTFGTILLLPVFTIGWLWIKFLRTVYAIITFIQLRSGVKVSEKEGRIAEYIKYRSNDIIERPARGLFIAFAEWFLGLFCIIGILGIIFFGIWGFIVHIGKIPMIIAAIFMVLSVIFTYISWIIGFLLTMIRLVIGIVAVWLWGFLTGSGIVISYCLISALLVGIIFYILISKCPRVANYFSLRYNGFEEALKKREEKREQLIADRIKMKKEMSQIPVVPSKFYLTTKRVFRFLHGLFNKLLDLCFGGFKKVGSNTYEILGIFPAIWLLIKSTKDGVCPIVEFIDDSKKVSEKKK